MQYRNFTTFNVSVRRGAAWVTFLDAPLDPSGAIFLDEMSKLLDHLECDARIDAIVFQSRFPEVFSRLAGYKKSDPGSSLQIGNDDSRKREFKRLLARIENLPQTTIAKVEGMAGMVATSSSWRATFASPHGALRDSYRWRSA